MQKRGEEAESTAAWRLLGNLQLSFSDIRNFLKQEKRERTEERGEGGADRDRGGGLEEREGGRGGGIKSAEQSEPAALEDVSPPRQDVRSRSARRPRGWDCCHGHGQGGAHLPTGDTRPADPTPVEPDQAAHQ